ncbi:MAG: OmpA family protein [Myxococcales bacterium]|nr:OmpA family protein [Myxococcales bacterium]
MGDQDGDGVEDGADGCPWLHARVADGCPQRLRLDPGREKLLVQGDALAYDSRTQGPSPQSEPVLQELAVALAANRDLAVRVEVHTFERSDAETNSQLSLAQAVALRDYLVGRGVRVDQLEAVGCGKNRNIAPQKGPRRFDNRRIELRMIRPLPETGYPSVFGCREAPRSQAAEVAGNQNAETAAAPEPSSDATVATVDDEVEAPAPPTPAAAAQDDPDADGIKGAADRCPRAPGERAERGCPRRHRFELAKGRIALLRRVRFEGNGAKLKPRSEALLGEVAKTLTHNPGVRARIEVAERDPALASKRAAAIRDWLAAHGVEAARLEAAGCAKSAGEGVQIPITEQAQLPPPPEACQALP